MAQNWNDLTDVAFKIAIRSRICEQDAQDIAQEAILRLLQKYRKPVVSKFVRPEQADFRIVVTIVRNLMRDHFKSQKIQLGRGDLTSELDQMPSTALVRAYSLSPLSRLNEATLESLPLTHQRVIDRCLEGLTHLQISKSLMIPLGTVKTIIRRTKARCADTSRIQSQLTQSPDKSRSA